MKIEGLLVYLDMKNDGAKHYDLSEGEGFIVEYNKELDESNAQIDAGDFYTQDEVKKILADRKIKLYRY